MTDFQFWLDDRQWDAIRTVLPAGIGGLRTISDRVVISGILHVLGSGSEWSNCPPEYGPYLTLVDRYFQLQKDGGLKLIEAALTSVLTADRAASVDPRRDAEAIVPSQVGSELLGSEALGKEVRGNEALGGVSPEMIKVILESIEQGIAAFDSNGRLMAWNRRYQSMHELPAELCVQNRHILDLTRYVAARGDYGPGDPETLAQERWRSAAAHGTSLYRSSSVSPSGLVFEVTGRPMKDGGFVNTYTDVTEARANEARVRLLAQDLARQNAELEVSRQQFNAALDNMSQGLTFFDNSWTLIVCNRRFREIYGLSIEEANAGMALSQILYHRLARGSLPKFTVAECIARIKAISSSNKPSDHIDELRNGQVISIHHQPLPNGGCVVTHEDITERRRAEADIVFLARHDALTRLPNRILLYERLNQALEMTNRGSQFAVLCLDLDGFKEINDSLGHPAGDSILQAVAERLQSCIRTIDTLARLGGDEFVIIQLGIERSDDAGFLPDRIIKAFEKPFFFDDHQITVGTSIGVATAPGDGTSAAELLKNSDIALCLAKKEGPGSVRFFEPEMDARNQWRGAMENDLRGAVAGNQFELFYQPIVNLNTGRVSGFEALLRWHHPVFGLIPPLKFIPLAERTNAIVSIGDWVLKTACLEAMNWPEGMRIAVNLSPVQFNKGDLIAVVQSALKASGLPPYRLELEITESVLLKGAGILPALHKLREAGISLALDDFGTGYSSLRYLLDFPFSRLKIDRSFVRELTTDAGAVSIVRAIAQLSNDLDMETTAEGVETEEQTKVLRLVGCTEVQGYLFSEPRPAQHVPSLIEEIGCQARAHRAFKTAPERCE